MIIFLRSPSITQNTCPAVKWNKIWRNIYLNELSSKQRTLYYLLVNGKIITQQQQFKPSYKSVINPVCSLCGITETLEHIFKNCREIEDYWKMLKEIIESYQIKALAFNKILKPELKGISKKNGKKITILFINYIDIISRI